MIKRPYRSQRDRSRISLSNTPPGPNIVATMSIVATKLRVSCPSPIVVRGLPVGITRQAAGAGAQLLPTAVTVVDSQTFDLTFAASVVATDVGTINANVDEIRGVAGGRLAAAVKTF